MVVAALIPPNVVKMTSEETQLNTELLHGEDPWVIKTSELLGHTGRESTMKELKEWYNKGNEEKETTKKE